MAKINKTFKTKKSAQEMKEYISEKILTRPELAPLLEKAFWDGFILRVESKIGDGVIIAADNQLDVMIELSFFGSIAQKTIEDQLDKNFKYLESENER